MVSITVMILNMIDKSVNFNPYAYIYSYLYVLEDGMRSTTGIIHSRSFCCSLRNSYLRKRMKLEHKKNMYISLMYT
jgi:hypothetical protein